jgi:hypothetical protein
MFPLEPKLSLQDELALYITHEEIQLSDCYTADNSNIVKRTLVINNALDLRHCVNIQEIHVYTGLYYHLPKLAMAT